jgi:hypothetical protein
MSKKRNPPRHQTRQYPHPETLAPVGGSVVARPPPAEILSGFLSEARSKYDSSIPLNRRAGTSGQCARPRVT